MFSFYTLQTKMTDLQNASSTENFNEVKTTVDTQPKVATE
jgi:hypothetical protein